MGRASLQHLPLRSSLETCGRKGMVFGALHLTVTGLHQSGPYYCYDIRTDASWGTILRVLHDMIHLVFTMAHIISYHEATETQRDWLDSHSQQPSLLYLLPLLPMVIDLLLLFGGNPVSIPQLLTRPFMT